MGRGYSVFRQFIEKKYIHKNDLGYLLCYIRHCLKINCFGNSQMYWFKMFVHYLKAKAVCDWKEKNSYLTVAKWGESICNDKLVDIFADEHKNCLCAQVY